jgi:outer membrane protein
MRLSSSFVLGLAAGVCLSLPAAAQDRSFNFSLRGGVGVGPAYPGADSSEAQADGGFKFGALNWGGINTGNGIGNIPDNGLSFGGAFRIIGSRDADDNPELAGLEDIDTAVELGISLTYRQTNWLAFGEVRQGFGGHDGVTGTVGADYIFRPNDRLTISAGPRLNMGDADYANTYFGITADEAAASNFGAYDADGGLLGTAFQVHGNYELNDDWALEGLLSYELLRNSAADSPITQAGSEDQWRVSIGLSRAFTLRF